MHFLFNITRYHFTRGNASHKEYAIAQTLQLLTVAERGGPMMLEEFRTTRGCRMSSYRRQERKNATLEK